MDADLNANSIAICGLVMFVAAPVQCTLGIGGALIAAPIMAFYFP